MIYASIESEEVVDRGDTKPYHIRVAYNEDDEIRVPVVGDDGKVHTVVVRGGRPLLGHIKTDSCCDYE